MDYLEVRIRATMNPYNPSTSAKIRIRIIPTNNLQNRKQNNKLSKKYRVT